MGSECPGCNKTATPETPVEAFCVKCKVEMLKLLEAKQAAEADKVLEKFQPSAIQKLILLATEKIVLVLGANRSGKSECLAVDALVRSTGIVPNAIRDIYPSSFFRKGNYWLSALDFHEMRDVMQEKVDKLMPKKMKVSFLKDDRIYSLANGSKIGLKSEESGREKYQGTSRVYVGFDEEHRQDIYDECYMRTIDCAGILRMGFTPLKGLTWAYRELYLKAGKYYYSVNKHGIPEDVGLRHTPEEIEKLKDREVRFRVNTAANADPDIVVFQMTIYDNIHLPSAEIARAERKYSDDPVNYNARILGNFAKFTGREVFSKDIVTNCYKTMTNDHIKGDIVGDKFVPSTRGKLTFFKPLDDIKRRHMVIGVDISEGLEDGDASCAQILDHKTKEQVGVWHGRVSPEELPRILVELGKFCNTAWLNPERNFHGIGVINRIRDHYKYPALYCEYDVPDQILKQGSKSKGVKRYGWDTNMKTKPVMIQDMATHLRAGTTRVNDPNTVEEIQTYIYHDNGKLGAQHGCFDDRVIAYAIALQTALRRSPRTPYRGGPNSGTDVPKDDITGY